MSASDHHLPDIDDVVTADQLRATVDAIARMAARLGHGALVPGRPRGCVEPHRGAHGPDARRPAARGRSAASSGCGRPSDPTARGTSTTCRTGSSRTSSTPTASPTPPPACGSTGCSTATAGSSRRCGRSSTPRSSSCWSSRRPAARSSGPATPTARRGASPCSPGRRRSVTACAARSRSPQELGHERPDWELAASRLARVIRDEPDAFAPKHRWAMDWYYPVLTGAVGGDAGREQLAHRLDAFVMDGWGIRCVSDRPWITAAETCECAMAHLAVGEDDTALTLFALGAAAPDRGGPLLDRDRPPRRGPLPRRRAVDLHRRRPSSWRPTRWPGTSPASGPVRPPRRASRPHRPHTESDVPSDVSEPS